MAEHRDLAVQRPLRRRRFRRGGEHQPKLVALRRLAEMLHALAAERSTRTVLWLYGTSNRQHHPFAAEVRRLMGTLTNGRSYVCYSRPDSHDRVIDDYDAPGHLSRSVFDSIGVGQWFRYVTGAIEVTSAVLLLIPAWSPFGAVLLACTMIGGILAHLLVLHAPLTNPVTMLALVSVVLWLRRSQIKAFTASAI